MLFNWEGNHICMFYIWYLGFWVYIIIIGMLSLTFAWVTSQPYKWFERTNLLSLIWNFIKKKKRVWLWRFCDLNLETFLLLYYFFNFFFHFRGIYIYLTKFACPNQIWYEDLVIQIWEHSNLCAIFLTFSCVRGNCIFFDKIHLFNTSKKTIQSCSLHF